MTLRPVQRASQILTRLWLVQPEFVLRHDQGRTNKPYAGFPLFDKNLSSRELFAQRNLSIRADDFDARPGSRSSHSYACIDYWSLHAMQ
jgi:hypothetical protein